MTEQDIPKLLAESQRACVVAAAGCGKTETICKAVSFSAGRQLVLTHTHAGVSALRRRLARLGVSPSQYYVDTIAGWALQYAANYPALSGLQNPEPVGAQWRAVYGAAATLLDNAHVRRVVQQSYAGVYVDEYQDCTADQHALIMKLAGILPCRVLGDPLQGIFDFGGQQLVRWEEDVFSAFERLPDLVTPWRWLGHNEELGQWLLGVRELLLAGAPIDLADAPVEWFERSEETEREVCMAQLRHEGQSVVGIRKWASECHALAKTLKGRFTSMEEMDCRDLLSWSDRLELSEGTTRASLALEFGRECLTTSMSTTTALIQKLQRGEVPRITARCPAPGLYEALRGISENNDLARVSGVLIEVRKQGGPLYRRELWDEMMRALRYRKEGVGESLKDAAWHCRNITRQSGRREESRSISRTLLIKGLEYDRALVLNADELGAKNLYVAITRGRRALTIVSRSRVVQPAARN